MQRTLITGANGFVGQLLCRRLQQAGDHVIAASSPKSGHAPFANETIGCDIRDQESVDRAIRQAEPNRVVHLAAITHIPTSFEVPQLTWQTNVMGSINVLEAIKRFAPECFVLFVSSADVYGAAFKQNVPLDEHAVCQPQNPYAASKLAAETAFGEYFRRGIRGVVARPFNHIGARQSPDFVTASFARQIAMIEAGLQDPVLKVGDLQASRDFLDVTDVCHAYERLLKLSSASAEYPRCFNIASGRSHRIADVLDTLLQMSNAPIAVEQDPTRLRPSDIPYAIGDSQLLRWTTGWSPSISLNETLQELLDYWRGQVAAA
ncbi:GDP-mannose 4,6-dehydratase [Stutzerimonas kunmingensis]|uniref:GDP-mannose 4,6-dehydratase n=1 Tax=Stutzerimonas kunmingensis TaxID=1211807 RepID=UPI000ECC140E|nr:GDP-mannose 4,6-dehydratase [Stutzerimonas kunmingensis]HAG77293.1 GDP-6-deoxy-D-lyxo-4-hexulose reductase [Pseudomonas sp.]